MARLDFPLLRPFLFLASVIGLSLIPRAAELPKAEKSEQPPSAAKPEASKKVEQKSEDAGADEAKDDTPKVEQKREVLSGKVVLLLDALKKRGIKAYEKEMKDQVVLETRTGELWPILSDWRGRALYQDERLRNRPVDLVVLRSPGIPYLKVLSITTFDEHGVQQLTDYWCEICSIPMYEIKDCECCQGPVKLRYRKKGLPDEFAPDLPSPQQPPAKSD